jgi:phosphoglycolate phosphatase-like HAD superfamily hydrolase
MLLALIFVLAPIGAAVADDPLPSWNDGLAKQAIVDFVNRVTSEDGPDFVPPPQRIAVFDNDGTLWSEQPVYFQFAFVVDRVQALAPDHPEWKEQQPFKAVVEGDVKTALAGGEKSIGALLAATHAGMTTDEFEAAVAEWTKSARHPRFNRPYTQLVYQPMLELLAYLRANEFKTFIVSGGGIDFMRVWAPQVYGIPPEQIVGTSGKTKFDLRDGRPVLVKLAELDFLDDGPGKPVGIHRHIGRRPIMAFGNSDGDFEMLQWTTAGAGPRFAAIVHHTDAEREWAYDRDAHVGRLVRGLDEAPKRGWTVINMLNDWRNIYPAQK